MVAKQHNSHFRLQMFTAKVKKDQHTKEPEISKLLLFPRKAWKSLAAQQIIFSHERFKLLSGTLPTERKVVHIKILFSILTAPVNLDLVADGTL